MVILSLVLERVHLLNVEKFVLSLLLVVNVFFVLSYNGHCLTLNVI